VTGRILAIGLGLIVLFGGAYAAWTLRNDRQMHDDRVAALRTELSKMRKAIARYKQDHGRNPHSLEELVPQYLHRVPVDPVTHQSNWKLDTEEEVVPTNDFGSTTVAAPQSVIIDVHSAAGPPYSDY